jgi:hypothetical protein
VKEIARAKLEKVWNFIDAFYITNVSTLTIYFFVFFQLI